MSVVNNRVKEVRLSANQTQEDFALKVGISRSNLALIETSKATPTYETIKKISMEYNVNPAFFFTDADVDLANYIMPKEGVINKLNSTNKYVTSKELPDVSTLRSRLADNPLSQRMVLLRQSKRQLDARLKRELTNNNPQVLAIKEQTEECVTVVSILSDVINNYFDQVPDPSDIEYYSSENDDSYVYDFPDKIDYKEYKNKYVDYYMALAPYLDALNELKSCTEAFLNKVKPLDTYEIIS